MSISASRCLSRRAALAAVQHGPPQEFAQLRETVGYQAAAAWPRHDFGSLVVVTPAARRRQTRKSGDARAGRIGEHVHRQREQTAGAPARAGRARRTAASTARCGRRRSTDLQQRREPVDEFDIVGVAAVQAALDGTDHHAVRGVDMRVTAEHHQGGGRRVVQRCSLGRLVGCLRGVPPYSRPRPSPPRRCTPPRPAGDRARRGWGSDRKRG